MSHKITLLTAAAFSLAAASPAFACSWGKSASHDTMTTAEIAKSEKVEEAMTTFDPTEKPIFEESAEAVDEVPEEDAKAD